MGLTSDRDCISCGYPWVNLNLPAGHLSVCGMCTMCVRELGVTTSGGGERITHTLVLWVAAGTVSVLYYKTVKTSKYYHGIIRDASIEIDALAKK